MLFGAAFTNGLDQAIRWDMGEAVDLCLSGPEGCSGPNSPIPAREPSGGCPALGPNPITADETGVDTMSEPIGLHEDAAVTIDEATMVQTPEDPSATPSVEGFIDSFRKPLRQPILPTTPRAHVTRMEWARERTDAELVPKRSVRLAAKSKNRLPKPEAQARKVMMKKIGVEVKNGAPR